MAQTKCPKPKIESLQNCNNSCWFDAMLAALLIPDALFDILMEQNNLPSYFSALSHMRTKLSQKETSTRKQQEETVDERQALFQDLCEANVCDARVDSLAAGGNAIVTTLNVLRRILPTMDTRPFVVEYKKDHRPHIQGSTLQSIIVNEPLTKDSKNRQHVITYLRCDGENDQWFVFDDNNNKMPNVQIHKEEYAVTFGEKYVPQIREKGRTRGTGEEHLTTFPVFESRQKNSIRLFLFTKNTKSVQPEILYIQSNEGDPYKGGWFQKGTRIPERKVRENLFLAIYRDDLSAVRNWLSNEKAPVVITSPMFHVPIRKKNVEMIQLLIEKGADVTQWEDKQKTKGLIVAVQGNNVKMVQLFEEKGANINQKVDKTTALMVAVQGNNVKMVELLINMGATIDQQVNKTTALMVAVHGNNVKMVQLLINLGATIDQQVNKTTALMVAVQGNNVEMVQHLLDMGANVNKIVDKKTVLQRAIEKNSVEMVQMLLKHPKLKLEKKVAGKTALMVAEERQNPQIIQLIQEKSRPALVALQMPW